MHFEGFDARNLKFFEIQTLGCFPSGFKVLRFDTTQHEELSVRSLIPTERWHEMNSAGVCFSLPFMAISQKKTSS